MLLRDYHLCDNVITRQYYNLQRLLHQIQCCNLYSCRLQTDCLNNLQLRPCCLLFVSAGCCFIRSSVMIRHYFCHTGILVPSLFSWPWTSGKKVQLLALINIMPGVGQEWILSLYICLKLSLNSEVITSELLKVWDRAATATVALLYDNRGLCMLRVPRQLTRLVHHAFWKTTRVVGPDLIFIFTILRTCLQSRMNHWSMQ